MWKWEAEDPKAVVVIVHGANEHHRRYDWLISMFVSKGIHVVMGDLPGQGHTSKKLRGHINSFHDYIEKIQSWIKEALNYHLPVFLLGHSMGGLAVIRTLQEIKLPVTGVILSSPCLGLVEYPSKGLDLLTRGLNVLAPSMKFNSGVSVTKATRNKVVLEKDVDDPLYVTHVSVRWYRELIGAMKKSFSEIRKLSDYPLLLIQGGNDKIVDKKIVNHWFNQLSSTEKTYKEYPELYHEVFNEPEREDVFNYTYTFIINHINE